ncbi:DsbA family protein [Falsihalocynthiibacter arcticus]|uniref:Thioredoxin domain-containing protein n=1 Tax=Falsihalocynthiibacter arcticus TaxID=1579316 RepID=A0A126V5G2_9RHOB|nr:DsbA family protein [Falsihalocynthiibacter arcticus]AML53387.1 hypothetical protein RC74_20910 [Falsihalocynthiibacter arcticus]
MSIRNLTTSVALCLAVPFAAYADGVSDERIKELALEAILENPQIVMEAVAILEKQRLEDESLAVADVLTSQRALLEQDPNAPVLGNRDGDVTVVEFFDYNCPYCRSAMGEVQAMLKKDQNVRLVYREWPILGEGSVFASKAALAARNQGKYEEFHWALMGMKGRADEKSVLAIAKDIGLDVDVLRQDMDSPEVAEHIASSMSLSQTLGFNGTPSFVIGNQLVPGFVEQAQLSEYVDAVREGQE